MKSLIVILTLTTLTFSNLLSQNKLIIFSRLNAEVYLDGEFKGKILETSLGFVIDSVAKGTHKVMLVKIGFIPQEKIIKIENKKETMLFFENFEPEILNNKTKFGKIKVMSIPVNIQFSIPSLDIVNLKSKDILLAEDIPYGEYFLEFQDETHGFYYKLRVSDSLSILYVDMNSNKIMIKIEGKENLTLDIPEEDIFTSNSDKSIFFIVEEMPIFMPNKCNDHKEGNILLQKYITENIIYPEVARMKRIEGKVYVSFVVNTNGFVTKFNIARGVDKNLNQEAIRVLRTLPRFEPGKQRGKPVNVSYTVPINFKLG